MKPKWMAEGRPEGLTIELILQSVASQGIPSWNQTVGFLESMQRLRDSAGFAA